MPHHRRTTWTKNFTTPIAMRANDHGLAVMLLRRIEMCEHHNFNATVRVARIEDKGRYMAEVQIKCLDCGVPMQFMGLQPGLNFDGATVSLDGLEMNIGIHPQGQRPNPMQTLLGYSIEAHN